MNADTRLKIRVVSQNPDDTGRLAEELDLEVGETATLEVSKEKAPQMPGRAVDPLLVMEVVSLAIKAIQTALAVAKVLEQFKKKKPGVSYVLENQETGQKIEIGAHDSERIIARKIKKITKPPGFFERLLKKKSD